MILTPSMRKYLIGLTCLLSALAFSYRAFCSDTIHLAAYYGDEQAVIKFLEQKPDPDARDSYGGTALHAAMFQNNIRIVQLLINNGYNVNAVGPRNGYTPVHDAAWSGNLAAIKLLVENDGDLTIKGFDGHTPLTKAREEGHNDVVAYLLSIQK